MQECNLRWESAVFIVDDVSKPGQRIQWAAVLRGGCVVSRGLSSFIVYNAAIKARRWVWISDGFRTAWPAVFNIIKQIASTAAESNWKFIDSFDDFQARYTARKDKQTFVGLATPAEIDALPNPRVMTHDKFMQQWGKPLLQKSVLN